MKIQNNKGFTIIEICAVVAVIGVVTALGFYVSNRIQNNSSNAAKKTQTTTSQNSTVKDQAVPAHPSSYYSCRISASESKVAKGTNVTITWSSKNTTAGTITGIGKVGNTGSATVMMDKTTKFTATFTDANRVAVASCSTSVTVVDR